jgi:glycosyltransferase involved in cell wall biosynthesis
MRRGHVQRHPNVAPTGRDTLGATFGTMIDSTLLRPASDQDTTGLLSPLLPGVSFVLPCLNEADNIADAVRNATVAGTECAVEHEVIVVDDGSTDGTAEIAAALAAEDHRVRVVVHPTNRGYGAALRSGVRAAQQPWVLLTDADLQFDLRELVDFVPLAAQADLIAGWRIARQDPLHRRLNAAAWNWLVRGLFDLPVRDVDCAFKLIRRDLVDEIPLTSGGAMISTELVVRLVAAGARVREVGVHHRPRVAGEQSGASPRVVVRAFRELARLHGQLRHPGAPGLPA